MGGGRALGECLWGGGGGLNIFFRGRIAKHDELCLEHPDAGCRWRALAPPLRLRPLPPCQRGLPPLTELCKKSQEEGENGRGLREGSSICSWGGNGGTFQMARKVWVSMKFLSAKFRFYPPPPKGPK